MHLPYMRPCQNNNNCVTSKKITENGIFQQRKKKKIRGCFKSAGKAWKNRAFLE